MRVSLARQVPDERPPALPLLDRAGARVVVGGQATALVAPIAPAADSLFAPRGVLLASREGPLLVSDTGHHRVLVWHEAPSADRTPADLVLGQPHFAAEGRNAGGDTNAASFNVPTGIAASGSVVAIADAWNHRVLLWAHHPRRSNQPADLVLGQPDFESALANRGLAAARADTLYWPYGVAFDGRRMYVADTGNRRLLVWDSIPQCNGAPADRVFEGAMRWPHAIAVDERGCWIADAGLQSVLAHTGQGLRPGTSGELNMPYGITLGGDRLIVADTGNSRLLGFDLQGSPASRLAGQPTFAQKGENRWRPPARDSLCWPFGVAACEGVLAIADTGNNRVLLWDIA